ncbi:MAG TPA: virulence protein RhuM/Fic/DOC family protein [Bacteroidales bacterium]|nr:virulence protein RhuM/Fic/DOC family protein [Bacteroidales bacterium]
MPNSEIRIFQAEDGKTEVSVRLENETVWLNQYQLEELFETDRTSIVKHISNIYKTKELNKESTCAKIAQVQKEGNREITRNILFYNLDLIIAVGYRVNSKRGTQFRIWANKILKDYLLKGYVLNEKRLAQQNEQLKELQESIKILGNVLNYKELSNDESKGLLKIISDYAYALDILDQYDYQRLEIKNTSGKEIYKLTYKEALEKIDLARKTYGNSNLFGNEKDKSFESSINTIYQTFNGDDLYPSIEEKAANLLYFITKNHSFTDGNKRIAAFLFLYFLEKNKILIDKNGNKRIADNTLVALTLMIAVSKPEEKDTMIKVVVNLINKSN